MKIVYFPETIKLLKLFIISIMFFLVRMWNTFLPYKQCITKFVYMMVLSSAVEIAFLWYLGEWDMGKVSHVRCGKCFFANIQKQRDVLKISLFFKKFTNFTGK